jgi:hypothetical protein
MSPFPSVLVAAALLAAPASEPTREIENVAAFARLYGVVRYFYPSDSSAELDWNRFAVYGVSRVRGARDEAELGAALELLVSPLGPGLEIGPRLAPSLATTAVAEPLVAWRYLGAGFSAMGGAYRAKRTHRASPAGTDGFVTLMQTVPAAAFRGMAIRLRGLVRATPADAGAGAALWLRVDRANQAMGFFDNMGDRPVRDAEWRSYVIEGTVAEDAENIAFGVMAVGAVTADFDTVELAVRGSTADWTPIPVQDAGFEESATGDEKTAWFRAGPGGAAISWPSQEAPQGAQYVRFAPPGAGPADDEIFAEGAPAAGAHADLDLGSGLRARVPLALTDSQARPDPGRKRELGTLHAALARVASPSQTPDVDQRLADVVVAWNVFRHFYPYWKETGVDSETRLRPSLEAARAAQTRAAQLEALQGLVADVRDGHGFVTDTLDKSERGEMPARLAVVEGRVVIASSGVPSEVPVGAEVLTIDAVPVAERLARETRLASGSIQWRQVKALWPLSTGRKGASVRVGIDDGSGPREVTLSYGTPPPPVKRPEPLAEVEPGLWYVDLTRATMAEITTRLDALATARGLVFEMRGYPTDAGFGILPHLLDAPETDLWMHVAKIVGPFYETAGWQDLGWDVNPKSPRLSGRIVFLTDGGAISYAESVMGYVADLQLGTIVGGTTAGTNGNVASFLTPGGFNLGFTAMWVTGHDGQSQHHLVGIRPDVSIEPTLAGLRAGRDEVLERGIEIARSPKPGAAGR